ncbi:hypothetical protein BC829DRAFT_405795 [Chytridium lagenaria]|nr:hypothetical protein BC829DRAFT_405795 [Chytridium lagenaria]
MEVPRRIVENLRLKNLLKRMETAGTLPEEHLLNPTLRQSEQITALRHLNARVRYRTLQREVDDERFYKWGIEGSIVQKVNSACMVVTKSDCDHIAMIAGILEDMPRLCDGRDEIWRRLLERVRK